MEVELASIDQWPIPSNLFKSLKDAGKLQHPDGIQWIERNTDPNSLPYSAVFRCEGILIKLLGEYHLLFAGADYINEVRVDRIAELDNSEDFDEAVRVLRKHIKLGPVLRSGNRDACNDKKGGFEKCLSDVSSKALQCSERADGLLQLCRFFKKHKYQFPASLGRPTSDNQYYTSTLNAAKDYFEVKEKSPIQGILFKAEDGEDGEDEFIKSALEKVLQAYQQQLLLHCSSVFKKKIDKMCDEQIFLITLADIELFSQLENIMTEKQFEEAFAIIRGNFVMAIKDIPKETPPKNGPMSNRMYYFVLKSLMEVSKKLRDILQLDEVVTYGIEKWTVTNIRKDHKQSLLVESLCQQLKMLTMLANHYEPGAESVHLRMSYNFKNAKIENALQDDVYVFLCFLDYSFEVFMTKKIQAGSMISDLYSLKILKDQIASGTFTYDVMKSLCSITQHVLDLLGQSFTMIIDNANSTALEILQKQVSILKRDLTESQLLEYLDVFILYSRLCSSAFQDIADWLSGDCFRQNITIIQTKLLQLVSLALDKNENLSQVIEFFKQFEEFLTDLRDVSLTWYIRLPGKQSINNLISRKVIELVNNKWKGTEHQCYIVKNDAVNEFTTYIDDTIMPKHYQVAVLECFLQNIIDLAQKWTDERNQLDALSLFIATIRSRFPHFKRQPDYIDFEIFFLDNIEPFLVAVENNESLEGFKNRMLRIEESFRRINNTNSIGIDRTLELIHEGKSKINAQLLKSAYTTYKTCFEGYIVENSSLNRNEKIMQMVESVQSKIKPLLLSLWSAEFKQKSLPEIVAGLAAAWSMMASKGNDSSESYIIPHRDQILCILRLLSVDQSYVGVANHFAQVYAGQGKSLILALTVVLLALFGRNVSVICYNRYLAKRDAAKFKELFELFYVSNRISYNAINDMMENHSIHYTEINGNITLDKMGLPKKKLSNPNQINSVLLIDEVDAFLVDKIYGNTRSITIQPLILGLDVVQLKIWHLIQAGDTNVISIVAEIYKFVSASNDIKVNNLKNFIKIPQKYSILVQGRNELTESVVTNRTLFSKHLHVMIQSALKVHSEPIHGNYKLDNEGRIACRNHLGEFTPSCYKGYYNTFVYFKLKGNNFMQNVGQCKNYGYFIVCVGELSYVQLLASHPLILGVTGGLMALDSSEEHAIKNHYKIQKDTFMPSSFGSTLLKFDQVNDFKCISTEVHWMNTVVNQINTIISTERSVLVFFNTEGDINKFKQKLGSQLDRLHILTVDTEADIKEQFINDAGVEKTVTLATREMGQGVDFKSGPTVETNGGLHVIQTFFSLDVKEETHIKGRTARRDCRGSYEQIVCIEHLVNLQLINPNAKCDSLSYAQLDRARKSMAKTNCEVMARKLELANVKHAKTVKLYGLLPIRGDPSSTSQSDRGVRVKQSETHIV